MLNNQPLYKANVTLSGDDNDFVTNELGTLFITIETDRGFIGLCGAYHTDSPNAAYEHFVKAANQAVADNVIPTSVTADWPTGVSIYTDTTTNDFAIQIIQAATFIK